MKQGLDPNKILGGLLVASLVAALSGFLSQKLVAAEYPEKKGLMVVAAAETGAPAAAAAAAPAEAEAIDKLAGNAENGQKLTRACAACHSFDKGGPNRVGPALAAVYGGPQAAHEGFAYSEALKAHKGTWSLAELNKFLFNPKAYAPGTKMAFAGLPKAQDRADVIAYLKSLSGK